MKTLLLGILLLVGFSAYATDYSVGAKIRNPCVWPEAVLTSITGATTGTSRVQLVALDGTKRVYVCSVSVLGVSGTSTPTFSLVSGTGTACASSTTTVMQSFATVAATTYAFANPAIVTTAGHELCYLQTGTNPVSNYLITYVQQ